MWSGIPYSILNISPLTPPMQLIKLASVYCSVISNLGEFFFPNAKDLFLAQCPSVCCHTHRSRTRIRYPSLVFYPSVVGPLLVCVRSIKHSPYVCHAVHTHSWATENGAVGRVQTRHQVKTGMTGGVDVMWSSSNIPGGREDGIHYRVFVISGRKHEDVLYKKEGRWW